MRTQQIFISSRNRDTGSPTDLFLTFPNGLIKERKLESTSAQPDTSIELAEFAIPRMWYDVQTGVNDSFRVYRALTMNTYTITIPPGWYTIGEDNVGSGVAIEPVLIALLNNTVGGNWQVVLDDQRGSFIFRAPAAGGFSFNFVTIDNRCHELLGFDKAVYVAANDVILAPRPFNLSRTSQIVMHTDIQPAFPQCTIDNYGLTQKLFDNSDIMAVIPVDQPPRGLINYQSTEKINRITIKPDELRTVRIFFTDDRNVQLDLALCEWTAVLRVVYGDNLSV